MATITPYFKESEMALEAITETFNIVWPLAIGLWNLRCGVHGIKSQNPDFSEKQMAGRFAEGSGIHGFSYKQVYQDKSWEQQKEELAWLLLNSLIPIYEAWECNLKYQFPQLKSKELQFPGVNGIVSNILKNSSKLMTRNFYSAYSKRPKRCYNKIENLMKCYRVFKELRNCYMHNGKIANSNLVNAFSQYSSLTANDLDSIRLPEVPVPTIGDVVSVDLGGVIGFSEIVQKIILSIDTELIKTSRAEILFDDRIRNSAFYNRKLDDDISSANKKVVHYIKQLRMSEPKHPNEIRTHLQSIGLLQ